MKAVKKQWIEDYVINEAMTMLNDDRALEKMADMVIDLQNKGNAVIPLLRQKISDTEKQIENMLNAIAQGVVTSSTKRKLTELEREKENLEIQLLQEEMSSWFMTREQMLFWLHRFRELDITRRAHRIRLIDVFVNAVYVGDDGKVTVVLNYKDGARTVTLEEITDVFGSTTQMCAPPIRETPVVATTGVNLVPKANR